ncbi:MAG: crotonase/enoyl-CoA hydratase family protein [Acidimicrobiia bacterium]
MTVHTESDGPVLVVTIDRPERRNAVDGPTATALTDAFRAFEADDGLSVAVLTGADGMFCAGADLKAILEGWDGSEDGKPVDPRSLSAGEGPLGPTRMLLAKPVIAAVEGFAVAGGLELALWCDLRVAARDAVFGVFCRRWGVPLIDGGTVRLPRLIGMSRALDMILTGRGVSGDEAMTMGLANRLAESGGALEAAVALAHELARLPQACMREDRASTYEQAGMALDEALRNEHEHGIALLKGSDFRAGVERFGAGEGRHGASA